ncbi:hypothetical protein BC941DRAFT_454269 [Chlamydoabsidia padenii]|nr:hypothetical protein BC941DRAFT_454269 [Chlamydoabsidia padenii]
MSTLNTFGFNVRRKRQQDAPTFSNLKPGKSIPSMERSLAFTATPISSTPTNTRLRTTQLGKPRRSKDPKQSTLLPFFTTTSTTTQQVAKGNDNNISDGQDEGTQVCVVRRHITIVDLMPILMETFQGYNNTIDRPLSLKGQHNSKSKRFDTVYRLNK